MPSKCVAYHCLLHECTPELSTDLRRDRRRPLTLPHSQKQVSYDCGNSVQYGYKTKHVVYQNVQCIKQAHTTSFVSSNLTPPRGGRFSISITVNGLIDGRWLESSTLFSVNVLMRTCNPCLGSEKLLPEYEPLSGKIFVDRFA